MTLIVEDGTGLANAESYASVAEFKAYCDGVGYDYAPYVSEDDGDALIEQALRRATIWIDARYGSTFKGCWSTTTQALEWPRSGVVYRQTSIASDEIPTKLKNALCEAAWRELTDVGSLAPDQSPERIKRDRVGDVETEFSLGATGARASYPMIDALLSGLTSGMASAYVGKAVRG